MGKVLEIVDETSRGEVLACWTLLLESECATGGEIIERRVRAEVEAFNRGGELLFHGLVQPTDTERVLNGYRLREPRPLDADAQVGLAREAFLKNQFLLLVDDRQVETLDEEVLVTPGTKVSFIRLVPLVGG